ncbi:sialate O-acetylesterase [Roseimicrobium gellanilyticum]|uniref:Sialate O-acetylesterase n=1 Tax=Roseimicrobium gellanilyticum TaxID=748857 RepID=A0A366HFH9_9BACT|nr:sialate O-acetylesterase [Roseimicrobium gellanilyticum]RBP41323.1 sialate O-acetylesterase [Roseimicrobium gellanilyticum]
MHRKLIHSLLLALALTPGLASAELKLPSVIGDHMVLQQKQSNPIWGWDTPGTKVSVTFAGKMYAADADKDGKWTVKLDPQVANANPQVMNIKGTTAKDVQDILIGEVWMCSGQSNMGFTVAGDWKGDLEALASKHPGLRLFALPMVGTQDLKTDIDAKWELSNADTAKPFSAVGFFFGRYLHEVLGVPVGLIDNAWGGSSAEAWVRRSTIESDPRFKDLMERWKTTEKNGFDPVKAKADFEAQTAKWKEAVAAAKAANKPAPQAPRAPQNPLTGQHRPGNIFAGMMHPTLGYGIKGVIWYQGESNAGRALEYRDLFPFMITEWRKEWKQGDFPFYWVQLADFMAYKDQPGDSAWAELREAQTLSQKLPNSGQAVITDLGEANDIHPKNKYDVAARLVRWALAKDYGIKIAYRSPELKSHEIKGNKVTVTVDCFGSGLRTVDVNDVKGFAICGEDKKWVWAQAKIVGNDKVEVWSEAVAAPKAVRFAWSDNPVFNLISKEGLPVTPFRTDDFEMVTKPKPAVVAPAPAKPAAPVKPTAAPAKPAEPKTAAAPKKA